MSRTDKTDPYYIKTKQFHREHHNHINGVCELASNPLNQGWKRGECYIDADLDNPVFRCGCSLCDGSGWGYGPRDMNRRDRKRARKEAHEAIRTLRRSPTADDAIEF